MLGGTEALVWSETDRSFNTQDPPIQLLPASSLCPIAHFWRDDKGSLCALQNWGRKLHLARILLAET
jgi:hypothetical protein